MKSLRIQLICLLSIPCLQAYACRCISPSSELWVKAKAAFVGKIISEEDVTEDSAHNSKRYKVTVLDSLKDPMPKIVTVVTPLSSAGCGVKMEPSKIYTVFSTSKTSPYSVNLCSGTHEGDPSKDELRALKRPR